MGELLKEILNRLFVGETEGSIKKKKNVELKNKGLASITNALIDLRKDEFILTPNEQMILPTEKNGSEMLPLRFKNKFKSINLSRLPKKEYIHKKINPEQLIFQSLLEFYGSNKKDFSRRGISWTGISDNRKRFYSFSSLIDGWKKAAVMSKYNIDPKIGYYGQKAIMRVISKKTENEMRKVSLDSMPINIEGNKYFAQWVNLAAQSDSPEQHYRGLTHKYETRQVIFGSEMIAAYILRAITDKGQNPKKKILSEEVKSNSALLNPFLAYTELFVKNYNKLQNNLLVSYKSIKSDGKEIIKIRKPNQAERDNLSSWIIAKLNPEKCFRYDENFTKEFVKEVMDYII